MGAAHPSKIGDLLPGAMQEIATHDPTGGNLLDEVCAALTQYVVFPSSAAADAVTLFIAATHGQAAWEHATRLVIKSPIKRCGKTRLQEVAAELCHRAIKTSNISVAALVRSIDEDDPPTFVLDEGDSIFGKRRGEYTEGAEDLRRILNAGYGRGFPYHRWNAQARKQEACPTFAMAIIGGIGDFPDTIEDRAVIVGMRRRAAGEHVASFRRRRAVPPLQELRERLHAWVRSHMDTMNGEPELPVDDRAADTWEPLVTIADAAGGSWPGRARTACIALTAEGEPDEATAGERLLADLRDVFGDADRLPSATILERLHRIEEAPWSDYFGRPLNPRALARLLRPYGVRSRNVRIGTAQTKGYTREDFLDSWRRYLGADASQASQRPNAPESPAQPGDGKAGRTNHEPRPKNGDGGGTEADAETRPRSDQGKHAPRDAGTDGTAHVRKAGQSELLDGSREEGDAA